MSTEARIWAKRHTLGNPTAKAVLLAIADFADEQGEAWPSQRALADLTEFKPRAVRSAIAFLQEVGLLRCEERRRADGGRTSDRLLLDLTADPLALNAGGAPPAPDADPPGTKCRTPRHHVPGPPAADAGQEPPLNLQGNLQSNRQTSADHAASVPADSDEQRDKQARQDRRDQVEQAVTNLCAITGRSRTSARAAIGSWLSLANEELYVVVALIDEADRREIVDPTMWIERQLKARRDQGRDPPTGARQPSPRQPTGNVARSLEIKRLLQEREHGNRETDDIRGEDQPGPTRGDDHGLAWAAGGDGRPAEPVLRAARAGGHDHRAAAALRRMRAPRGAA